MPFVECTCLTDEAIWLLCDGGGFFLLLSHPFFCFLSVLFPLFEASRRLGHLLADYDWSSASDPDGKTFNSRDIDRSIKIQNAHILKTLNGLKSLYSKERIDWPHLKCNEFSERCRIHRSNLIERENRPFNIKIDDDSFINMTDLQLDFDVKLLLSFGHKFVLPINMDQKNKTQILSLIEFCVDSSINPILTQHVNKEIYLTLKKVNNDLIRDPTIVWLNFAHIRLKKFFENHLDVAAIRSDKGNHTILIYVDDYKNKIYEHLNSDAYVISDLDPTQELVETEKRIMSQLSENS